MLTYNDIYEVLRKEKFSENLQQLPKNFLYDFSYYIESTKNEEKGESNLFGDSAMKSKKQLENSMALFKELILRRKKKLLNLVFVAAETGIMKRDYENMIEFERNIFDKLVKAFEEEDKELGKVLNGKIKHEVSDKKLVIFGQDVQQFIDMNGALLGPFNSGQLANLENEVAKLFVSGGKARYVDS